MNRIRHTLASIALLSTATSFAQMAPSPAASGSVPAAEETPKPAASDDATKHVEPAVAADAKDPGDAKPAKDHWYDKLAVRGYVQFRYNNLLQTDPLLVYPQNDKGIGGTAGFTIRRARLQLLGDIHPRVYLYFQSDFASDSGTSLNFAQIRDLYADLALDDDKEFRFRVGQSKIPFGFENMQSSSNRAPLDRTEAINSATPGERDLGVFFYWAPKAIRARFKHLVDSGLKGSGDYGVVGLGTYNGQGVNRPDTTPSRNVVARVTWPFDFEGQFVEVSAQAMMGDVAITRTDLLVNGTTVKAPASKLSNVEERRAAATLVVYPQPIGFQAEAMIGEAPVFDFAAQDVKAQRISGYYGMLYAKVGDVVPFVRYARYEGSRRTDDNALPTTSTEIEGGVEYSFNKYLELTAAWQHAKRFNAKLLSEVEGSFARVQLQLNY